MGQFGVIGVGNFGYYLGRHLYEKGHEVIALDISKVQVQKTKDVVSHAVVADATDREALESLGISHVDAAVVCIGTRMQASILATLHLKELGTKSILAKATSEEHGRILRKVGASEIFFPEKRKFFLENSDLFANLGTDNRQDFGILQSRSVPQLHTNPSAEWRRARTSGSRCRCRRQSAW